MLWRLHKSWLIPALDLAQNADDLLAGKSLLHRVLLVPRIKESSLAGWLQETTQVSIICGFGVIWAVRIGLQRQSGKRGAATLPDAIG